MAIIPVKVQARNGDNVRLFIETPDFVYDISLDVQDGFVKEIGHGHLLIDNKTDADINTMIDNAFEVI